MAVTKDCKTCEFRGYSPELCKMHRRYMTVADKNEKNNQRRLAAFDKVEALAIIRREERQKMLRDAGYSAALGAVIGSSGGFIGTALIGGALAAIASPLMVGAAVAGAGIAAAMNLGKSQKKGSSAGCCKNGSSLSPIYGSCGQEGNSESSLENY